MKVEFKDSFLERLKKRVNYISVSSPSGAKKFKLQLFVEIRKASKKPFQCRKSIYFEDEQIRDLIYKGHTITYKVEEYRVVFFGFKYYQNQPFDK